MKTDGGIRHHLETDPKPVALPISEFQLGMLQVGAFLTLPLAIDPCGPSSIKLAKQLLLLPQKFRVE